MIGELLVNAGILLEQPSWIALAAGTLRFCRDGDDPGIVLVTPGGLAGWCIQGLRPISAR